MRCLEIEGTNHAVWKKTTINNSIFDDMNVTLGVNTGMFALFVFASAPKEYINVIRLIRQTHRHCSIQHKYLPLNKVTERLKLLFESKRSILPVLAHVKVLCQLAMTRMTQFPFTTHTEYAEADAMLQRLITCALNEVDKMVKLLQLHISDTRVSPVRFWQFLQFTLGFGVEHTAAFSSAMSFAPEVQKLLRKQRYTVVQWLQSNVLDFDQTKLPKKKEKSDRKKGGKGGKKQSGTSRGAQRGKQEPKQQQKTPRRTVMLKKKMSRTAMEEVLKTILRGIGEEWDSSHCTFMAYNGKCVKTDGSECTFNHNCVLCGGAPHKLMSCPALADRQ